MARGSNEYGQLGLGHSENQNTPQEVVSLDTSVKELIAGGTHVFAIIEDNSVKAWGW